MCECMCECKKENTTEKERVKERVTEAEVIVTKTFSGFMFHIKYKKVGEDFYNIGYSSYNIHFVFQWLNEYFEIVKE